MKVVTTGTRCGKTLAVGMSTKSLGWKFAIASARVAAPQASPAITQVTRVRLCMLSLLTRMPAAISSATRGTGAAWCVAHGSAPSGAPLRFVLAVSVPGVTRDIGEPRRSLEAFLSKMVNV